MARRKDFFGVDRWLADLVFEGSTERCIETATDGGETATDSGETATDSGIRPHRGDLTALPTNINDTAWTPLFIKIGGVMLSVTAFATRKYGIPAALSTWNIPTSIRNGDKGKVEVVKRA